MQGDGREGKAKAWLHSFGEETEEALKDNGLGGWTVISLKKNQWGGVFREPPKDRACCRTGFCKSEIYTAETSVFLTASIGHGNRKQRHDSDPDLSFA